MQHVGFEGSRGRFILHYAYNLCQLFTFESRLNPEMLNSPQTIEVLDLLVSWKRLDRYKVNGVAEHMKVAAEQMNFHFA